MVSKNSQLCVPNDGLFSIIPITEDGLKMTIDIRTS